MWLQAPKSGDVFCLVMFPVEWSDVHALAKFAQAGIAYDAQAPYVLQVFVYPASQPQDILGNENTLAAFAEVDRLAVEVSAKEAGEVILWLPKEAMRQLLVMAGKAAESEDQAELVHYAVPEKFPYAFPDIEVTGGYYADAFDRLLRELHEDRSVSGSGPLKILESG